MVLTIKKNGQKIWVTFTFSPSNTVENVAVSGEWNEWEEEPMKLKKSGDYYITKVFKSGDSFQFGYKVNGNEWMNEEECSSVPSPFISYNSLLAL